MLSRIDFENRVDQALQAIPELIREKLTNVAFVIEDGSPTTLDADEELLGLYEGVPLNERTLDDSGLLPDKITLFRSVIAAEAAEENMDEAVILRETVWHEVAHYFGFDEDGAERLCTRWEERWQQLPNRDGQGTP